MAVIKKNSEIAKPVLPEKTVHQELVERAKKWLLDTVKCSFVLVELSSFAKETPDAIGWKNGNSILVECKADRVDFLSDRKKAFRRCPEKGIGKYRFYFCPPGVIKPKDLPRYWGLLYSHPKKVVKVIAPRDNIWTLFPKNEANLEAEIHLLCSALRRVHLRGDLGKIYDFQNLNSPNQEN